MARIVLELASTGESVPVIDIDLASVTNKELIDAATREGILNENYKEDYYTYFKGKVTAYWECKNLSSLGIVDGSIVRIGLPPGYFGI